VTFTFLSLAPELPLVMMPVGYLLCLALIFLLGTFDREESENIRNLAVRKFKRMYTRAQGCKGTRMQGNK
jgi:hypothetical protein